MNMRKIDLPQNVCWILNQLTTQGYEAYTVGGCVRDSVLGKKPKDWDITTNATPEEIMACFPKVSVIPTGLQHGTVTIVLEKEPYEITTYRIDGDYEDHRRPSEVIFTRSLKEDLARRDFTINALAYHPDQGVIDYFGGLEDCKGQVIRCVGDPDQRFLEDALRILRCTRFACELGFRIETNTANSMMNRKDTLKHISAERIQIELSKSLLGNYFAPVFLKYPSILLKIVPEMKPMIGFEQNTPYHIYDVYKHTLKAVEASIPDLVVRLTMLFHDIGKPECYAPDETGRGHFPKHPRHSMYITEPILKRLKYSNEISHQVLKLVDKHGVDIAPQKKIVCRWLNRLGEDLFLKLLEVQKADATAKNPKYVGIALDNLEKVEQVYGQIKEENLCYSIKHLAINGQELMQLGFPQGPQIGEVLQILLEQVISEKVENTKDALMLYAKTLLD